MNLSTLRTGLAACALVLVSPAAVSGDAPGEAQAGERKAQPCLSCHTLDSFAAFEAGELPRAIKAVAAGETGHIPLPMSLSDEDLADIAAFIAAANAAAE